MKKELSFSRNGLFLLLVFTSAVVFSGCRKDRKNPITFSIDAYQPHINAPVSGIKWTIIEKKKKGFDPAEPTGWTLEGETDLNGQARGEFIPFKNLDYSYEIHFDYSEMDLPNGEYSITKGPTTYALLHRPVSGGDNDFEVRILPKMDITVHYKNLNCFDASDTFKYKSYNTDEHPNYTQAYIDGMSWSQTPLFNGCTDHTATGNAVAGNYIYIWEAVRNGITETGTDTFFVSPGINSTINMHW